ncbi:unnamed protein product [Rotaria socialis]|uniref:Transposase n=1 Tax=Rotaria socialis TaxID=392032 RepID=A0A818JLR2_9BILA|nr:unnamed protein product [Rotaria socialis]CAF4847590.1 unnamed protein product [Rotaria socialis]
MLAGHKSWFYDKQIDLESSNAAWVTKGNPPPTIIRRNKFASKTLLSIFFKSTDPHLIHHVKRGQTIDHQYYIGNCSKPLLGEIKHQRPSCGRNHIILHQDSGKPHVHKDLSDHLELEGFTAVQHPPNSPALLPCGFWLFDLIKRN